MYEIEARIKKNTINNFVKLLEKSPVLNIESIKAIALEVCILIEDETKKDKGDIFI